MDKLRRVVGSTVIALLGQAVTWSSTLLLTIAYGHFLGAMKFGELYSALNLVLLVGFPLDFGFNRQLIREVAKDPNSARTYLINTLVIKMSLWLVLYFFLLGLSSLLKYNGEMQTLLMICGFSLLSSTIATTFSSLHYAREQVLFPTVGSILEKGLSAIVGYLLLLHGGNVEMMAFVLLSGSLVNMCWQAFWLLRSVGVNLELDRALVAMLLRTSVPFLISGALGMIYYRIDAVLLSIMANTTVVGWYGAGYRLFDTLLFLPTLIINPIMYPLLSKLSATHEKDLLNAIEKCTNFLLYLGTPIAAAMIVASPAIISLLYPGADFSHAAPVLQYLAPGLVFLYINTMFSNILLVTKRESKITVMAGAALVFNLTLNLLLIPRYLHIAAALVTSLTELLLLLLSLFFIPRHLLPVKSVPVALKTLIASVIMALVMWSLHQLSLFLLLPVAGLTYIAMTALLRTFPREDLISLYQAIRYRRNKATDETSLSLSASLIEEQDTVPLAALALEEHMDGITPSLSALYLWDVSSHITMPLPIMKKTPLHRQQEHQIRPGLKRISLLPITKEEHEPTVDSIPCDPA